jgi:glucan endo-1,3-alpha-glucosidase
MLTSLSSASASKTSTSSSATPTAPSPSKSCNAGCAVVVGAATPASAPATRSLYAHHIIGNTFGYTTSSWSSDFALAVAAGIDGFALNLGSDSWEAQSVAFAYQAATASFPSIKLFFSFDFTSLTCSSTADASSIANYINTYASSSAQVTYNSKTLVSSFSGDSCTFGQSSVVSGWNYVRTLLKKPMFLVPAIFSDPSQFNSSSFAWLDGELNWNSGWPMGSTALTIASDQQYMADLGSKAYMAAASPCFFTYYGPNSFNKDWIYRSDDWLLALRMEQLASMRGTVPFAEIISWNDFGESHYIGPITSNQPGSQGWVNGMPHTGWLGLIAYYAPAFKTGSYPAIKQDQLFLWSRPHSKNTTATSPTNAKPTRWQDTDDNLYAVALLTAPATVQIYSGSNKGTFTLPAGLSKLLVQSSPGTIGGSIIRNSATVKSWDSAGSFSYVLTPVDYNFNYFVQQIT